ncbi:MAG: hypothetical protein ACYTJ0_15050 [Planctomycetota bacterium]|jgi:hypothetical protein
MTTRTLAAMSALGGSLLLSTAADAAYVGLGNHQSVDGTAPFAAVTLTDGTSWHVWRIYAYVDNPADSIEAISGNAANPIIVTGSGAFYQNKALGPNNVEPNPALFPAFPDLQWDTFVTIGRAELDLAAGATMTQGVFPPDGPGFMGDTLMVTNGAWFRTPGNPATVAGADLKVLIAQLTVPAGEGVSAVEGVVRVAGRFDGEADQFLNQTFQTPAPGPWMLLGLAGLSQRRHRRR